MLIKGAMFRNIMIAGFNLFDQWFLKLPVIEQFQGIDLCDFTDVPENVSSNDLNLLLITWSYNIYEKERKYYICGSWASAEHLFEEIKIPVEYSSAEGDFYFAGNNYFLILWDSNSHTLWRHQFNNVREWNWKQIKLPFIDKYYIPNVSSPCEIKKICVTISSCICLTSNGGVYELPLEVDVSRCFGKICDVQCGYEHIIMLTDRGRIYTWGNGRRCQLGHGKIHNLEEPTEVEALAGINIIKIQAGGWHCLALSDSGDLYAWGWNDVGQLGICENPANESIVKSYALPNVIDLYDSNGHIVEKNVKDFAAGTRHSIIVLDDNTVWTTGFNKYGQLGFSPKSHPSINYFTKTFECTKNCKVMCGPWSSVLVLCDKSETGC